MKKLLFFCLLAVPLLGMIPQEGTQTALTLSQAPDFNLKGTDGQMHSLASYKNVKGYIVVFTCNTCPFAQAYEQRIIAIHKKYAPKGMPVVAINPNDPNREPEEAFDKMVTLAKDHKYPFHYLQDLSQETARAYGAQRTPHVFVLNAARKVIYIGAIDDNFEEPENVKVKYLEDALNAFLAGKKVPVQQTKAIGCGIKWKK